MSEDILKNSNEKLCIWLVDDDAFCRSHFMRLLNAEPWLNCSRSFSSAVSLLAALRQESPPDAIFMDVQMPDMNGIEAIRPAKDLAPFTKVFILTTFYDNESAAQALAAGATGFLLKRYPSAQIINAVSSTSAGFCSTGHARC